jgi:phosphoribosylaminoimidazole-succinocarboxamide synthase
MVLPSQRFWRFSVAALVRDIFTDIISNPTNDKLWNAHIWQGPTQSDVAAWQAQGFGVYQGKVRTMLSREGRVQMLHSDRLTAFDRLIDHIPCKGVILSTISKFWLEEAGKHVPTHFIKELGPRALLVENLRPIKIEVVVRGFLAGALLRSYIAGERVYCGIKLPDGLRPYERLPEPIITPTTKAAAFEHDEAISVDHLINQGLCTLAEWDQISAMALKVFSLGTKILADKHLMLVDSKYEFGKNQFGEIKLIDEVHTPDSSRLWKQESYTTRFQEGLSPEMLDKEIVRRWLMDQGFSGFGDVPSVPRSLLIDLGRTYLSVAEALTGKPIFAP